MYQVPHHEEASDKPKRGNSLQSKWLVSIKSGHVLVVQERLRTAPDGSYVGTTTVRPVCFAGAGLRAAPCVYEGHSWGLEGT